MKRFLFFLLTLPLLFWLTQPAVPVRGGRVSGADYLSLEPVKSAATEGTEARYKRVSNFISPVFTAPYEFQLLGLNWEQSIPDGTQAIIELRFQNSKGDWSDWEQVRSDQDYPDKENSGEQWSYSISGNSIAFQYRATLSTNDAGITPKLADIRFDYIDGGQKSTMDKLTRLVFDQDKDIVTREEWGADEAYLYASNYNLSEIDEEDEKEKSKEDEDYPELEIVKTVSTLKGKELLWPVEYPKEIKKVIIHHTASTKDLDDPEKLMRSIYAYHALTRGWGDIGYNYLIDSDGKIYEGRYGGDGAVGGHTAGYNTASVGIALLGNFEENLISAEMMKSLMGLVYDTAVKYDIDPDGSSEFRGEMMPNILGHRDLGATLCPGAIAYEYLDQIRESLGKSLDKRRNMNFDEDYAYEEIGDREMLAMGPEDKERVTLKIKNTGNKTWNEDTFLTYDINNDGVASIEKDSQRSIAKMKENSVKPGESATFTFDVNGTLKGGMTHFNLAPIFNGEKKTTRYMDLTVYVEQPEIDFKLIADDMPAFINAGQKYTVTVDIKNEGNFTWLKDGDYPVKLMQSGASAFTSKTILAEMQEDAVKPGENASFKFQITGPEDDSKQSIYIYPAIEGSTAIAKATIRLSSQTSGAKEGASIESIMPELEFEPGEKKYFWIELKNTGAESWSNDKLGVSFDTRGKIDISSAYMRVRSLPSGASAKVFFMIEAPSAEGRYSIKLMPDYKGQDLLGEAYKFDIVVTSSKELSESSDNTIRIKLTPDEVSVPVLTSSTDFDIYGGDELLQTFNGGSRVFVDKSGDGYSVGSLKGRFLTKEPVRIVPKDEGIIEILSMSQVPAWNLDLNDNKFRGVIEVREEEGELILINELPLEDYLKGIAEVSNDAPPEKAKSILVLARSYAYYYMTQDEKFPGKAYDLDDDPDSSQKYLGYGFESRSENIADYVEATKGQVITYEGVVVKTPYFSQSPGYTKSAKEVWGWTDTPWLQGVQDPYCEADSFEGHGVGLSGCGASKMAEVGFSYEEIIDYYYQNVELSVIME